MTCVARIREDSFVFDVASRTRPSRNELERLLAI